MAGPWLEDELLQVLPAPRPEWILAPGALCLAVSTPRGVTPYRWHSAVAVAWACSPATGTWGVLLAWEAMRRYPGSRPRMAPRCSWLRCVVDQCTVMKPTQVPNAWGLGWWGTSLDGPAARAIEAAVASLPEELRGRAVIPADPDTDLSELPPLRRAKR